jgi:hypothetical protein
MLAGTAPLPGCEVEVVGAVVVVLDDVVPALGAGDELQAAIPSADARAPREKRRGLRIAAP